jgi:tetratricopeptide (TPR) repeat protein
MMNRAHNGLLVLAMGLVALLFSNLDGTAQAPAGNCKMALAQGHHEVRRAQNKKALELFREALADPSCAGEAQLGLATAYNADNDHKKAHQAAEAALRLLEDAELLAEAHYQVGLSLDRRGARMTPKKEQAVKAFEQALELSDGEHRGAVRALLRIFKETHAEERQATLEKRFPGVKVSTRAEQRRALRPPPKKAPEETAEVAPEPPGELPEWERVGDGEIYDCKTRERITPEELEVRLAKYSGEGPRQWDEMASRPEKIDFPIAQYTEKDRKSKVNGVVIVQALIETDGTIPLVRILKGLTEGLNFESVKAICRARFDPARDASGEPVPVYYNLTNNFRLQ